MYVVAHLLYGVALSDSVVMGVQNVEPLTLQSTTIMALCVWSIIRQDRWMDGSDCTQMASLPGMHKNDNQVVSVNSWEFMRVKVRLTLMLELQSYTQDSIQTDRNQSNS